MSAGTVASLAIMLVATVGALWALRDMHTVMNMEDFWGNRAWIVRRARLWCTIAGLWMICIGVILVILTTWTHAILLFVVGPVYIVVGNYRLGRYDQGDRKRPDA